MKLQGVTQSSNTMNLMKTNQWLAALSGLLWTIPVGAGILDFAVGEAIPDGNASGIADVRTVAGLPASVLDLRIRLDVRGMGVGGMINGDLYATLAYESVPGQVDAFSVLLNRVGRDLAEPDGYFDNGFHITFAAGANDIHRYRETTVPAFGNALTGVWGADGRESDPSAVLTGDGRTAVLDGFQSLNPNGRWTLFVADLAMGGEAELVSWGIEYTPVPEPGAMSIAACVMMGTWACWRRGRRSGGRPDAGR